MVMFSKRMTSDIIKWIILSTLELQLTDVQKVISVYNRLKPLTTRNGNKNNVNNNKRLRREILECE